MTPSEATLIWFVPESCGTASTRNCRTDWFAAPNGASVIQKGSARCGSQNVRFVHPLFFKAWMGSLNGNSTPHRCLDCLRLIDVTKKACFPCRLFQSSWNACKVVLVLLCDEWQISAYMSFSWGETCTEGATWTYIWWLFPQTSITGHFVLPINLFGWGVFGEVT